MQAAQSIRAQFQNSNSPLEGGQGDVHSRRENDEEQKQLKQPPDHATLLKQGYKPLNDLLQEEFDYYIRNQGSTTWQQKKQLERFAAHRNASPEVRKQIEQETGWFYHPEVTTYAKRDPAKPLVRTKFKGLPRY